MISPRARRSIAAGNVVVWSLVAAPGSWLIPTLDEIWFQRTVLLLSFIALVIPAVDVWQTTDVRTEQEEK